MQQLKTFEVGTTLSTLESALQGGAVPPSLEKPMRAMVVDIAARAKQAPVSIYVCSVDADRKIRDQFAFVLVKSLLGQQQNVILVDCDFLSVGLSGIVPLRDALGFLDLLLYGSSLGVISQQASGDTRVIGAGSFPVAKKSPFVMDTFDNASRYLLNNSECVVFCGPCLGDDDEIHPIVERATLPIVVRHGARVQPRILDPIEETLSAGKDAEMWSVRIVEREPEVVEPAATTETDRQVDVSPLEIVSEILEDEPAKEVETQKGEKVEEVEEEIPPIALSARSGSPVLPRVITAVLAIVVVAFLVWWLYLTNSIGNGGEEPFDQASTSALETSPPANTGPAADTLDAPAGGDSLPIATEEPVVSQPVEKEEVISPEPSPPPTTSDAAALPTSRPDGGQEKGTVNFEEDISVFAGRLVVHVSSFRLLDNALLDADYLAARGHSIIISQVDLGSKGLWYRVYAGPVDTSDAATSLKKSLDEYPRVKSTRIQRVRE